MTAIHLPAGKASEVAATVVGVAVGVSKVWNLLEDKGIIPSWLK